MRLLYIITLFFLIFPATGRTENLAGMIRDVNRGTFISEESLVEQLKTARFVLLGEVHDNKRHHDWQAKLLDKLTGPGRERAVVFEMVESSKQNAFAIFRSRFTSPDPSQKAERYDATGLDVLLDWDNSGWPDWAWYKPLFDIAMLEDLPIGAGGLSRYDVGVVHKQGPAGLSPDLRAKLQPWLDVDWPEQLEQRSRREIREGHCNALPDEILPSFSLIQRLRDTSLSQGLVEQAALSPAGSAVLIAGNGHVRKDLGVPHYLVESATGGTALSVGMIEIRSGFKSVADYAALYDLKKLPFDYVIFTERTEREDPCTAFRDRISGKD